MARVGFEPRPCWSRVRRFNHSTTLPTFSNFKNSKKKFQKFIQKKIQKKNFKFQKFKFKKKKKKISNSAPTTSHLNVVVQSPSLHWGGSKWLVNSPRVSSSGDSPLDNSSHFLSLLSNARSHVDSTLKPN